MKRTLIFALGGIVLLAGITAWQVSGRQQKPELGEMPSGSVSEVTGMAETAPPDRNTVTESKAEDAASMSPAKRIRHGTAAEQDLANATLDLPSSGNEKSDRLRNRVETALEGDIDGLIDVSRLINRCGRGMNSEEQLQARLDRAAQSHSRNPDGPIMPSRGGGGGGSVEYKSFEDMEADMWARFDECQVVKNVLDESLYEQVQRLAETGLPSARYLYAIWPPDQDSLIAMDTLELFEYQSLALEYTWMNMQQRDPLGLLAMSQSYGANRPSMFTPRNPIQAQVFRLASMKCGINNKWLTDRALNFGQGFSRFQGQNTEMPSLDEDAAALAEKFCPAEAKTK